MTDLFIQLNKIIEKYDSFILMGHKNPDLDVLGSCLALYSVIKQKSKDAFIFIDKDNNDKYNNSIQKALSRINFDYVNENTYNSKIKNTLLIIVDVHQQERLESSKILDLNLDTVVIDHHIMHKDYIKNTLLLYNDTTLSSVSELLTYYCKYCDCNPGGLVATILLGAIEIDTNGYNLKTTSSTYKAASYLMDMGADTIMKQELLKQSKDDYIRRADYIKNSFMVNDCIAICILDSVCDKEEIAEIADELLKFVNVEVSFVIGKLENKNIGISARSIGHYDVEKIMKQFNGGGHTTNAAAEVSDKTILEIKNEIIKKVGGVDENNTFTRG